MTITIRLSRLHVRSKKQPAAPQRNAHNGTRVNRTLGKRDVIVCGGSLGGRESDADAVDNCGQISSGSTLLFGSCFPAGQIRARMRPSRFRFAHRSLRLQQFASNFQEQVGFSFSVE